MKLLLTQGGRGVCCGGTVAGQREVDEVNEPRGTESRPTGPAFGSGGGSAAPDEAKPEDMGLGNDPSDGGKSGPATATAKPKAAPTKTRARRAASRRGATATKEPPEGHSADGQPKVWPHRPETVPPSAF